MFRIKIIVFDFEKLRLCQFLLVCKNPLHVLPGCDYCTESDHAWPDCTTCKNSNHSFPQCAACKNSDQQYPDCNKCKNADHVYPLCSYCVNTALAYPLCSECKMSGHAYPQCAYCQHGFYNYTTLENDCLPCECDLIGSFDSDCEKKSGQCNCKMGFGGSRRCDICEFGTGTYPNCEGTVTSVLYRTYSCFKWQ